MISEVSQYIIVAILMGICIFLYALGFLLLYYKLANLSSKTKKYWVVPFIIFGIGLGVMLLGNAWFFIVDFIMDLFY